MFLGGYINERHRFTTKLYLNTLLCGCLVLLLWANKQNESWRQHSQVVITTAVEGRKRKKVRTKKKDEIYKREEERKNSRNGETERLRLKGVRIKGGITRRRKKKQGKDFQRNYLPIAIRFLRLVTSGETGGGGLCSFEDTCLTRSKAITPWQTMQLNSHPGVDHPLRETNGRLAEATRPLQSHPLLYNKK